MAAQCPAESFIVGESSSAVNNVVKQLIVTPSAPAKGKKRAVSPAAQPLTQPASSNSKRRKVQPIPGLSQTQVKPGHGSAFLICFCLIYLSNYA